MPRPRLRLIPGLTQRQVDRFWDRVDKSRGSKACWPWRGYCNANGYGVVRFGYGKSGTGFLSHHVAYQLARGYPGAVECLRHRCDAPSCCNPDHLVPGSHAENMADKARRGRTMTYKPRVMKLDSESVRAIRVCWRSGEFTQARLAKIFDVHRSTMSEIVRNKSWRDK